MRYSDILNEMFAHGSTADGDVVIAFGQDVWFFDFDDLNDFNEDDDEYQEIINKLHLTSEPYDGHEMLEMIKDTRPDIFTGYIRNNMLHAASLNHVMTISSPIVSKLMKQFKFDGYYHNDTDYEEIVGDGLEDVPVYNKIDYAYHGTNLNNFMKILKVGLTPTKYKGNYDKQGIKFTDRIFLTQNLMTAKSHAQNSARIHKSIPVIITTNIPDKTKIVGDYDVMMQIYGKHHSKTVAQGYHKPKAEPHNDASAQDAMLKTNPKHNLETKMDVFAYKGSIRPNSFSDIYVAFNFQNEDMTYFKFDDLKEFKEALEIYENIGEYYYGASMDDFGNNED